MPILHDLKIIANNVVFRNYICYIKYVFNLQRKDSDGRHASAIDA